MVGFYHIIYSFQDIDFPLQCDVSKEDEVTNMFEWIEGHKDLGRINVCIPNAGFSHPGSLMVYWSWISFFAELLPVNNDLRLGQD